MLTLLKISWKNLWRNPLRSSIMVLGIAIGLWGGIMAMGLGNGMIQQRFKFTIERQVSHIQIHQPEYPAEREVTMTVPDGLNVLQQLQQDTTVKASTARVIASGMAASAAVTSGVSIRGVYPQPENELTSFKNNLVDGDYFESDMRNPILLGQKLAQKLNLEIGNRMVLTFQDLNGDITSGAFRVAGIFKTVSTGWDETNVLVRADDLQSILGDTVIHEIAILLNDEVDVDSATAQLQRQHPDVLVRSWRTIAPELNYMQESAGVSLYVFMIIILAGLAFGILNIMLMAVFERTREIGMLMAIGMNKLRVFGMIMLETIFLSITGGLVGIIAGALVIGWLNDVGIDFGSLSDALEYFGYETMVYPDLESFTYVILAMMVMATAVIASIYPAIKALKLNPAEAVRKI